MNFLNRLIANPYISYFQLIQNTSNFSFSANFSFHLSITMPTNSPPSPQLGEGVHGLSKYDPRGRSRDPEGTTTDNFGTDTAIGAGKSDYDKVVIKSEKQEPWSMEQLEEFFSGHGYKDEVDYVKGADVQNDKLEKLNSMPTTPMESFSLKMGLRVLELIKVLRKLESSGGNNGGGTSSSWGNSSFGGGGGGSSSFDFSSGGGRGRGGAGGGGGGSRACFKCNETGHFARECPTGGGGGGGGGRGGGSRVCFKCNEPGHISRDCTNGGGGGGGRGGGRYESGGGGGGGDSSFSSSWGGGGGGGDDRPAKRPRQEGGWSSGGGNSYSSSSAQAPPQEEEAWG
ncbi:unnamed protein product [Orchesella dallaii]|uniref:CCHC-type domain-containing protein n=2 Tax=Orchesella dallaii TaxID=48710 RepID=A0ABP1PZQ9_9HEXA